MIWEIIFWIAVITIIHSYLFFPLLLALLGKFRKGNTLIYTDDEQLPFVSIIMAAHNEEEVIIEKLRSVFDSEYPEDCFEFIVGSDHSSDRTNEILKSYSNDSKLLRFFQFEERRGKPAVINELREKARGEILIMTDANVYFRPDSIYQLVKHFKNKDIGLVGANLVNTYTDVKGVSIQEWTFLSRENRMKYYEGKIWGTMIGAEGGCYSLRNKLYTPVPEGFAVDDFYITMKVLEQKAKSILDLDAICIEDVSNSLSEAFRRKVRISSGNYHNLKVFKKLLWPLHTGLSFSFLSHKVLRWIGPFALIIIFTTNILIYKHHPVYWISLLTQLAIFGLLLFDLLLRKIRFHIVFLRFITHFYSMNLALLLGFFKYLKRDKTDVWEPTRRTKKS